MVWNTHQLVAKVRVSIVDWLDFQSITTDQVFTLL